jgi:hypothetical protein
MGGVCSTHRREEDIGAGGQKRSVGRPDVGIGIKLALTEIRGAR